MNDRFLELPGPRRRAMVNAGFEVFSRCPYAKAPMSEVAAAGNVSKSLLFHYFENKLGLYLYLWDTAMERISRSTQEFGALEADDLFEALWRATQAKCRVMRTHPLLFAFTTRAYYEEHPDVRAAVGPRVDAALASAGAAVPQAPGPQCERRQQRARRLRGSPVLAPAPGSATRAVRSSSCGRAVS
ncbi:TetR/AcrR family transcriptional regulator [Schaalia georgiae]|nr:TetR/AcrR family transcriptional regulator [Schaalia georgiae]